VTTGSRRVRGGGVNTVVLAVLRSPARMLVQGRLCALRFAGRRTGTVYTLPVEYTRDGDRIVVLAGRGRTKSWWHNFLSPHPVRVWLDGRWQPGTATVARSGHPHRTDLLATYRSTHPRVPAGSDDPLVVLTLAGGAPQRGRSLWLSWFGSVTLGECLGFAVPATVGAVAAQLGPAVFVPLLVLAGAVEGALLGWFQARVLRRVVPGLPVRRWTGATAAGAALAWTIGLLPSTLGGALAAWPAALLIPVAAIGGLVLLGSIGTAQWLVLRAHVRRAGHWIWATAAAWVLALGLFTAVTTPLWQPDQSVATIVLIGVLGGVVMAATVAAVTGIAVVRLCGSGRPNGLSAGTLGSGRTERSADHGSGERFQPEVRDDDRADRERDGAGQCPESAP
jgi:hypothetical protein